MSKSQKLRRKSKVQPWSSPKRESVKFVGLFVGLSVGFYLFYCWLRSHLVFLSEATATIAGFCLSPWGINIVIDGALLSANNFSLRVIDECTAVYSSMVYASAILAYPASWKSKGIGLLGIPILYVLNLIRLVVLILVGIHYPDIFEFVHVYLWQGTFIIFIILIFLLWINIIVKKQGAKAS